MTSPFSTNMSCCFLARPYRVYFMSSHCNFMEVGSTVVLISQMRKLRPRDIKQLVPKLRGRVGSNPRSHWL